jgi:uncharacterized membrane protein YjjP (DUF1212 family)
MLRRLLGTEDPTVPVPIVERLRGTPYHDPQRLDRPERQDVRASIELVVRIAALLIRCGTGTAEVETSALAAAAALGLRDEALDLDITYSAIVVGYAPRDEPAVALVRVVSAPGRDYARMSELHRLVVDLVGGRLDLAGAQARTTRIEAAPKPYKRGVVTAAWGGLSAAVVLRLGGGWAAVLTAFLVSAMVDEIGRRLNARGAPPFFVTVLGAAVAATSALLLSVAGNSVAVLGADGTRQAALVVAGGIVVLLPGIGLVAAVQDGIRGFPVTAAGRLVSVLLTTGAIIAGVAGVLALAPRLGGGSVALDDPLQGAVSQTVWAAPAIAAFGSACAALASRTPPRLLLPSAVAGGSGFAVFTAAQAAGAPAAMAAALACVLIGALGRVWALRRVASPLAVVVPATSMLLPGLVIFVGLRELTGGDTTTGLISLLEAATIATAIAGGVVLGDLLGASVERGLDLVGRRGR